MSNDGIILVDRNYSQVMSSQMPRQIAARESSFNAIVREFMNNRLQLMNQKVLDKIGKLEMTVTILPWTEMPKNYIGRKAIKLKNNMMLNTSKTSDDIYTVSYKDNNISEDITMGTDDLVIEVKDQNDEVVSAVTQDAQLVKDPILSSYENDEAGEIVMKVPRGGNIAKINTYSDDDIENQINTSVEEDSHNDLSSSNHTPKGFIPVIPSFKDFFVPSTATKSQTISFSDFEREMPIITEDRFEDDREDIKGDDISLDSYDDTGAVTISDGQDIVSLDDVKTSGSSSFKMLKSRALELLEKQRAIQEKKENAEKNAQDVSEKVEEAKRASEESLHALEDKMQQLRDFCFTLEGNNQEIEKDISAVNEEARRGNAFIDEQHRIIAENEETISEIDSLMEAPIRR